MAYSRYVRPAFQAIRQEVGHGLAKECTMRSFCTDPTFVNGVMKTANALPEHFAQAYSNSGSFSQAAGSSARFALENTFGATTKGNIAGMALSGLGNMVVNGANNLSDAMSRSMTTESRPSYGHR